MKRKMERRSFLTGLIAVCALSKRLGSAFIKRKAIRATVETLYPLLDVENRQRLLLWSLDADQ